MLPKWKKKDLQEVGSDGYKIYPAKDEQEALEIKQILKDNKRNAQAGYYQRDDNKDNPKEYFVVTRHRNNGTNTQDKGE